MENTHLWNKVKSNSQPTGGSILMLSFQKGQVHADISSLEVLIVNGHSCGNCPLQRSDPFLKTSRLGQQPGAAGLGTSHPSPEYLFGFEFPVRRHVSIAIPAPTNQVKNAEERKQGWDSAG